jgi:hypothetical protein
MLVAQLTHYFSHILSHRAFGVIRVIRFPSGLGAIAIPAQVSEDHGK